MAPRDECASSKERDSLRLAHPRFVGNRTTRFSAKETIDPTPLSRVLRGGGRNTISVRKADSGYRRARFVDSHRVKRRVGLDVDLVVLLDWSSPSRCPYLAKMSSHGSLPGHRPPLVPMIRWVSDSAVLCGRK
jgi:hypothetical protein